MSKQTDLEALAALVRFFTDQEIPTEGQWNENPTVLKNGLLALAGFMTDLETATAAVQSLLLADHAPDGKNPLPSEWVPEASVPTFVNNQVFQLAGDRRSDYAVGHRIRATIGASTVVVAISAVGFDGGANVTNLTVDQPVLTNQLTAIARGLVRQSAPKVLSTDIMPGAVQAAAIALGVITGDKLADLTIPTRALGNQSVTTPKLAIGASKNALVEGSLLLTTAGTTETALLTLGPVAVRGGPVLIDGLAVLGVHVNLAGANALLTLRWKRDGTLLPNGAMVFPILSAAPGIFPLSVPGFVDPAPPPGSVTYTLTGQSNSTNVILATLPVNDRGRFFCMELA